MYIINPDRTQPWNDLPLLPIEPEYYQDITIYKKLVDAKSALGTLHGRSAIIPNQGMLVSTIYLQEAKQSSAIENVFTTDEELYREYSRDHDEQQEGPAKEVLRYREAVWTGFQKIQNGESLSRDLIIDLFRQVKNTGEGIRSPLRNTYIRQGGSGPNAGKPVYTPPRAEGMIEQKLDNLIDFLNNDNAYDIDPLLKMIIGHLQFEAIHPFSDGNGRAGRILNALYLVQKGLLDTPILFMSRHILGTKDEYYRYLAGVTQKGDWKSWIMYMLDVVETTSWVTFELINRISDSRTHLQKSLEEQESIYKLNQLLDVLYTMPVATVKHLVQRKIYAENTARSTLNKLADLGVLEKVTLGGHHYYKNLELYDILS